MGSISIYRDCGTFLTNQLSKMRLYHSKNKKQPVLKTNQGANQYFSFFLNKMENSLKFPLLSLITLNQAMKHTTSSVFYMPYLIPFLSLQNQIFSC